MALCIRSGNTFKRHSFEDGVCKHCKSRRKPHVRKDSIGELNSRQKIKALTTHGQGSLSALPSQEMK